MLLCMCVFYQTVFSPIDIPYPSHPLSVPIRHPRERKKNICSNKVRDRYIRRECYKQDTRRIRYAHACGVWAAFLQHAGGTLGIIKVTSLHLQPIVDLCPLHIMCRIFPS